MQPINNYSSTVGKLLRVVLQGPPKSGKTCLACQFPKPYVIDVDVNLGGPIRFLQKNNLALPVGYDVLDKKEDGTEIPLPLRYNRLNECLIVAQQNSDVETIIIDSATNLVDIIIADVLRQQNKSAMSKQEWGFFYSTGKHFVGTLTSMRKHIILIAHEKINKTTDGSIAYPIEVAWPGQLGTNIGSFFTDIWRCEVEEVPSGMTSTYRWKIRTMPSFKYKLGNSLDLPPLFEFKWSTIAEKLK